MLQTISSTCQKVHRVRENMLHYDISSMTYERVNRNCKQMNHTVLGRFNIAAFSQIEQLIGILRELMERYPTVSAFTSMTRKYIKTSDKGHVLDFEYNNKPTNMSNSITIPRKLPLLLVADNVLLPGSSMRIPVRNMRK